MGVKGLLTVINDHYPQIKEEISIPQLAAQYMQRQFGPDYYAQGHAPILAIDGKALHRYLYGRLDTICGGQWVEYCEQVKYFCSRFQEQGIHLIFVFDGGCVAPKRKEWARRRMDNLRNIESTFKGLKSEPQRHPMRHGMPIGMTIATRYILENMCNVPVIASLEECDKDLSHFANDLEDCFAILSNDTDFLIFRTKYYLSCDELNLARLTTVGYNRDTLTRCLNLKGHHLPLLSCLMGNDVISHRWLKPFHDKLIWDSRTKPQAQNQSPTKGRFDKFEYDFKELIEKVAAFIRDNNLREGSDKEVCRNVSEMVFGNEEMRKRNERVIMQGLQMYKLRDKSRLLMFYRNLIPVNELPFKPKTDCPYDLLHYAYHRDPHIFQILSQLEYEFGPAHEDPEDTSIAHSSFIFKLMRQRVYYLLLRGMKLTMPINYQNIGSEEVLVQEWIAAPGNRLLEPDLVPPLPFSLPPETSLRKLWFDQSTTSQALKYKIFYEILNLNAYIEQSFFLELSSLPRNLWLFLILLKYLTKGEVASSIKLEEWELKAIITQAVNLTYLSAVEIHHMQMPQRLDPRAIHLASLFRVGIRYLALGHACCGFHDKDHLHMTIPWNWIDGKLFQINYQLAKEGASLESLTYNRQESKRLSSKIIDLIGMQSDRAQLQPTSQEVAPLNPIAKPEEIVSEISDLFTQSPRKQAVNILSEHPIPPIIPTTAQNCYGPYDTFPPKKEIADFISEKTLSAINSSAPSDVIELPNEYNNSNSTCPVAVLVDI